MRKLLLLAIALLGLTAPVNAQIIVPNTLSGNECWNSGQGPGGPSTGFVCSFFFNEGIVTTSGTGSATFQATIYTSTIVWTGTAPTTWTVTTPANPFNGQVITLTTNTTLTTLVTLTANTGQSLSATYSAQTLTAGTSAAWQYNLATTTWYRLR